ncbi:MAG TPA: hypothetical protein VNK24_02365 [Elusimicrobiota bacterium]|nr:hypothetical protein [Elusimicrobiota bacterium]
MNAFAAALALLFAPSVGHCFTLTENPMAVLWVPAADFSNWSQFSTDFVAAGSPDLTIAVYPSQLTAKARETLAPLIQGGRIEIAARIDGDPILPLIASNGQAPRPQDALDLLSLAHEKFQNILGSIPAGYVPGGGAVAPGLFPAFKAMSLKWVATGNYPRTAGQWAQFSGMVLVPFSPITADDLPGFSSPFAFSGRGPVVIDEADGLAPEGSMLGILRQAAAGGVRESWSTVSDAVARHQGLLSASSEVSLWPTWAGDYALWNSSGPSQAAWSLYARAALDMEQYQNSGSADLRSLEEATNQLHKAQASRFFRLIASTQPATALAADKEFRAALRTLYREIDEPNPNSLYYPLVQISSAEALAAGTQTQEMPTDVAFSQGSSWIEFENPPQSIGEVPASTGPAVAVPQSPWGISSFRVDWSTASIDLKYQMQAAVSSDAAFGQPFNRIVLDTYIDVNHIAGAGSTQLLPGRNAYTKVADAWEYAVSLDSKTAFLYRSPIDGPPQLLSQLDVASDSATATLTLSIPRYLAPGDPRRWGYITASMATQPRSAEEPPPLRPNPDSSVILSILAPMESQEAFFANPLLERLGALRAPPLKNPSDAGN